MRPARAESPASSWSARSRTAIPRAARTTRSALPGSGSRRTRRVPPGRYADWAPPAPRPRTPRRPRRSARPGARRSSRPRWSRRAQQGAGIAGGDDRAGDQYARGADAFDVLLGKPDTGVDRVVQSELDRDPVGAEHPDRQRGKVIDRQPPGRGVFGDHDRVQRRFEDLEHSAYVLIGQGRDYADQPG